MGRKYLEFVATIVSVRWRPKDQDPPTIAIVSVVPEEDEQDGERSSRREVSVKIRIEDEEDDELVRPHASLRFYGFWSEYRGEKQFEAQTMIQATPHTRSSVITYLQNAPEIGLILATRLWEAFKHDAVWVLRNTPDVAADAVRGLSVAAAEQASEWLQYNAAIEGCYMAVQDLLVGNGFPKTTVKKAIREWGNQAAQIINRDPYKLARFRGCGFKRCDALYLSLKKSPHRLKRQALCLWYSVANPLRGDGSTWMYVGQAMRGLEQNIGGAKLQPERALVMAKRGGIVYSERTQRDYSTLDWDGDFEWLADARKARNEIQLAHYICEAIDETDPVPAVDSSLALPNQGLDRVLAAPGSDAGRDRHPEETLAGACGQDPRH